jgi:hypothetical protein
MSRHSFNIEPYGIWMVKLRSIRHADILKSAYLCQVSDTGSPETLVLIVDIISNCQTIIIDNYTKNRDNFFEWNKYNFDDIDKLMLKRKADDEFKIIVLKHRMFSMMVKALHSCNTTTVWALRSVQCHGKAISKRLSHCLRVDFKIREKTSLFVWKYVCNEYKKKFSNHYKIMLLIKNAK